MSSARSRLGRHRRFTNGLIIEQTLSFRLSALVARRRCAGVASLHQAWATQPQALTVKPLRELRTRLPAALRSIDIARLCLHSRALRANASVALSVCSIMRPFVTDSRRTWLRSRRCHRYLARPFGIPVADHERFEFEGDGGQGRNRSVSGARWPVGQQSNRPAQPERRFVGKGLSGQ